MKLFDLVRSAPPSPLDDLDILEAGLQTVDGCDETEYFWYHLRERERGRLLPPVNTCFRSHLLEKGQRHLPIKCGNPFRPL
jgi:hypothetical protein